MRATLSSFAHLGERLAKSQMTGLEQTATAAARTRADDPPRIRSEEGPPSFVVDAVASERRVSANFPGHGSVRAIGHRAMRSLGLNSAAAIRRADVLD
jgi:hypothetical protein